ncbi:molybdenum ABC transporter ATP-binding protein [Thiohalophilus thiocyanatoxydans]|uniref:Molybdate transport system ATP-binding protein n=1 Tax=Thiohalophilus thiocyanatoxydans TaxID=381308 RepID=A0A4R8IFH9_9GAMM|nr:molybdenum ABC transporter ATP-binding protein [Thiohalophilus thiocyanatoxydans]TDX99270.1 molybdate transport system ATP-binding protein [Thiohalophilus thiocyanatoxydans]
MSLQARFQLSRGDFTLQAEFSAPAQGITALFGPSGCGKTTLLRCIAGLEPGARGSVQLGQTTWQDAHTFVPVHRRGIGYVFQEANLFAHLSVRNNLLYGYRRSGGDQGGVDPERIIQLLGIDQLQDRSVQNLSGGERQRVAIGRALLSAPQLLLMDEPLAALDRESKNAIMACLQQLSQELAIPVLYVSHDHSEVAQLAQQMIMLDGGRVQATGPVIELLNRLDLPLAHAPDAETIVEGIINAHDERYGLSYLEFAGGRLTVTQADLPVGQTVRVRLQARDISLTLSQQTDTSILNIFPVTIEAIVEEPPAQQLVILDANGATLLARITRKSAEYLKLAVGKQVYAQVKSVALV